MRSVWIVGAGTGSVITLTREAEGLIRTCPCVIATERIAEGFRELRADIRTVPYTKTLDFVQSEPGDVAVLVSGDTGFFSAAQSLAASLKGTANVRFVAGIGSLQYFCAAIGTRYDDAALISLHGRDGELLGAVSYNRRVLALTGGDNSASAVCSRLASAGLGRVSVTIGENLGSARERIVRGTAAELALENTSGLAVMLIENGASTNSALPLRDSDFIRGNVPMTKEEIRWLAAAKLRISPTDTVFDIGAGTGSCAIEFARRASRGRVFAIERNTAALELIALNRVKTGAYNVEIVNAEAPDGLGTLPVPDCVFIGGSGRNLSVILSLLIEKNPRLRIVITAITLETLFEATSVLKNLGIDAETVQISAVRTQKTGNYSMFAGLNPVFIISGGSSDE